MKKRTGLKNFFTLSLLFLSVTMLFSCSSSRRSIAVEEGWELLGERKVNFVRDKDEMQVNSRNSFTAIRFRVEDRTIRISDLKIYFNNGDKLEPAIDNQFDADQNSRIIDLGREGKYIDKIEFRYRTLGNVLKGRGDVLVFGRKYNSSY